MYRSRKRRRYTRTTATSSDEDSSQTSSQSEVNVMNHNDSQPGQSAQSHQLSPASVQSQTLSPGSAQPEDLFPAVDFAGVGKKSDIDAKKARLERKLELEESINSLGFLDRTVQAIPNNDSLFESGDETQENEILYGNPTSTTLSTVPSTSALQNETTLDMILKKLSSLEESNGRLEKDMNQLKNDLKKMKKDDKVEPEMAAGNSEPIMHNGRDLSKVKGSRPSLFGLNLASILLEPESIQMYIISPQKARSRGRPPFPDEFHDVLELLKSVVVSRFPSGWLEAKQAINQRGLDTKGKE